MPSLCLMFTGSAAEVPSFLLEEVEGFFGEINQPCTFTKDLEKTRPDAGVCVVTRLGSSQEIAKVRTQYAGPLVVIAMTYQGSPQSNGCNFFDADVLVDAKKPLEAKRHVRRFLSLLYNHPWIPPDRGETAMMQAFVARLASSDASRQVGASIVDAHGTLMATGYNEVPMAGGGHYHNQLPKGQDHRDWVEKKNPSMQIKREMLRELLVYLGTREGVTIPQNLLREDFDALLLALKANTAFMDILEYSRNIHAEMSALLGALSLNRPLTGATLYTTTFPCHNCTKHLVGAGVARLVYLDPFSKSRALELFGDSVTCARENSHDVRVLLEQFTGVAPKRYALFEAPARENALGAQNTWEPRMRLV